MKHIVKYLVAMVMTAVLVLPSQTGIAGNEDRSGQAGADELLINPWARSTGWASANTGGVNGLEAQYLNVAGMAFTEKTEISFSHSNYLVGTGININTVGLSQRLSETGGVLGIGIMSMSFGDIEKTTVDLPEGGSGEFTPTYLNVNLSYSKAFSNSIYGGINLKIISEQISNVGAQGIAIDAGVQYVTGRDDQIQFGVALKNVGPEMQFTGDGMSLRTLISDADHTMTVEQRSDAFELPALIRIGATYDIDLGEQHELSVAGNFQSNSFRKDIISLGMEYSFSEYLDVRGGYNYEPGILEEGGSERTTVYTGPTGGASVKVPMDEEKGSYFSIDYSYRATDPFDGVHSIGASLVL
ncbi:MAG: PorV/PorQ family protein [Bacteroidales bacterium]